VVCASGGGRVEEDVALLEHIEVWAMGEPLLEALALGRLLEVGVHGEDVALEQNLLVRPVGERGLELVAELLARQVRHAELQLRGVVGRLLTVGRPRVGGPPPAAGEARQHLAQPVRVLLQRLAVLVERAQHCSAVSPEEAVDWRWARSSDAHRRSSSSGCHDGVAVP